MDPHGGEQRPHLPPPSLWPVGFAVGIVCILAGLVVSWPAVAVGAVIAVVFAFLWIRDVTSEQRRAAVQEEAAEAPTVEAPAKPETEEGEIERFPRSKFLEGATLGIGAAIGGVVTVPAIGFAILPAFVDQGADEVDVGPLENFPEGEWRIVTFLLEPEIGEVSRRTAYARNNGVLDGKPSFTIVSNRCVHLGCPVQPLGRVDDEAKKTLRSDAGVQVDITPTRPSGFGCPCHGGAYDAEGNRTAGPPVRAMDRYEFSVRNGRVFLGKTYSVGKVEGTGKEARITRYELAGPGQHVDGIESWLYPLQPP